jgi:rod shape-determining protein MreD
MGAAIGLGFVLLVVRATLLPAVGLAAVGPDLIIPLVVFYGATGRFAEGLAVTLVLGHLADVMSGGTLGLHLYLYAVAFGLGNLSHGRIDQAGSFVPCLMVFLITLVAGASLALLYGLWGIAVPRPAGGPLLSAALTAAFTFPQLPVLRALQRVSRRDDTLILPG